MGRLSNRHSSTEIDDGFALMSLGISKLCEDFKNEFKPVLLGNVTVEIDNRISKTLITTWVIDILELLSMPGSARFEEIRRKLPGISGKVLSRKLTFLEEKRLITREVWGSKPPRVEYQITTEGLIVARLVEPLFLYLRQMEAPAAV